MVFSATPARYHVRGRVISSDGINGVGCDRHRKEDGNDCEDRAGIFVSSSSWGCLVLFAVCCLVC